VKRKPIIGAGLAVTIFLILFIKYYYGISVHKHISITDITEIKTYSYNQQAIITSDKEKDRIVKGFNSIKSIKRQNANSLFQPKLAKVIIIKNEIKGGELSWV
jgi:hypothetical protein